MSCFPPKLSFFLERDRSREIVGACETQGRGEATLQGGMHLIFVVLKIHDYSVNNFDFLHLKGT